MEIYSAKILMHNFQGTSESLGVPVYKITHDAIIDLCIH